MNIILAMVKLSKRTSTLALGAAVSATLLLNANANADGLSGPHNYTAIQFQIDDLDNDRVNEEGYGWRVLHGIPLDDRWALEISGSGHRMERPSGSDRFFTFGADGIFNLNSRSYTSNGVSPFVGAGVGLFHDDTNNQPDNAFYANVTGGILVPLLGDLARLRIDARYALVISDSSPATAGPTGTDDTRFAEIIYGIGVQYALGQQRRKSFSCSSCDSDQDGIRNPVDYCPQSERFSSVDGRGCAVAPGSPDAALLPQSPTKTVTPVAVVFEPATNPVRAVGDDVSPEYVVPVTASVQQQVSVPSSADPNQYVPEAPAPTTAPAYIAATDPAVIGTATTVDSIDVEQIKFENGSARLLSSSTEALTAVLEVMEAEAGVNYEIQGHTDSQGSDAANLRLSQLRAHSVRNYLIEQGIDGWRLTAIGYGESAPIADNETAAGREKNRRVAFEPTR